MNYETMVKEAYEEILGLDKEAGVYREGHEALPTTRALVPTVVAEPVKPSALKRTGEWIKNNPGKAGAAAAGATALVGTGIALKKRHDKKKAQAEKAAAYYDEAQLVKEAAEANYAEACAYEEAALAILNELGYFED